MNELLRSLPQTSALLESEHARHLVERYSREEVLGIIREELQRIRDGLLRGAPAALPDFTGHEFFAGLGATIESRRRSSLRPVINATGIIVHTNLGRARLAPEALAAIQESGGSYSNLELDLETGERGSRHDHVEALIRELTGSEAALVVNNCAAAVLLCITALARNREVIASRGELIEIGGAFRLPDVIAQTGARLREVGTTNRTHLRDYEQAITADTALLLKSHTSNFRIVGFTTAPSRRQLADLANRHGVPLMEDLGSGVLVNLAPHGLPDEPVVGDVLGDGVDLVTFSGDKLLGGPQAGIIAGRRDIISELKKHPLLRALRVDKLSLAALEATLRLYLPPNDPTGRVPVLVSITESIGDVLARARSLAGELAGTPHLDIEISENMAYAGGGSLPQEGIASYAVSLSANGISTEFLAKRLRSGDPSVVGRISQDRLLLDMRTVHEGEVASIAIAVERALAG